MKISLEKKKYFIIFVMSIIISLFCYGNYIEKHYSPDTYNNILILREFGFSSEVVWNKFSFESLKRGRFGDAILVYLLSIFNIDLITNSIISNFLSTIFLGVSLFFCVYTISRNFVLNNVDTLKIFLFAMPLFINPLYSDWFNFPEATFYFTISLMLITICSLNICFSDSISYKKFLFYGIFLFFSLSIYQIVFNIFLIFSLTWILILFISKNYTNFNKNLFIKKMIFIIFIYLLSGTIQIIMVKYFGNNRISSNFKENIITLLNSQPMLWLMISTGKKNLILIITTVTFFSMNIYFISSFYKKHINILIFILYSICVIGIIFSTHIFIEPWLSQRTMVMLYGIPGILALIVFFVPKYTKNNYFLYIVITFICIINIVYVYRTNVISLGKIRSDSLDKHIAHQIINKIKQYEEDTGIVVNKISFKNDTFVSWKHQDVFCMYDLNIRTMAVPWARKSFIEFYLYRNLQEIEMSNEVYEKNFKDKNWDFFDESQLLFKDDILYIMVY